MPPFNTSAFRSQGSLDEFEGKRGKELIRTLKLVSNKPLFALCFIFAIFGGVMPLLMNIFMGDMVNAFSTPGTDFLDSLVPIIYKMIGFCVGILVVMFINITLRLIVNPFFMRDLRRNLYKSYMELDIDYFDKVPTGVMIGRLSQDVTMIHEIFVDKLASTFQLLAQSLGGIILAFVTCWHCALIGTATALVAAVVFYVGEKVIDKIWLEYNESSSAATEKAEEVITSFRTIKSFDCELKEAKLYQQTLVQVDNVFKKTSIAQGIKEGLVAILMHGMQAGILYYASYMIMRQPEKGYVTGDLFIIFMSLSFATLGISQAMTMSDDFKKTLVSCAKVLDVIERKPEHDRKKGKSLKEIKGKIEFRDVTFKYSTAKTNALEHLSFVINPGETVAFVGESGCGKSTTLQLIQRFYEIQSGEILLDDVNVKELSQDYVRSKISAVPQSPVLFTMTVADNIRYAKPYQATEKEVADAAQIGNAHNFIMEIPNNYKAMIQQTSLSGGQKQRICISRAILANAPILLLDEATAALDTESELLVQQSLERFRKGKTAIMVAHRLATVINSDRILVFSEGHVVEEGTHQQLLDKGGIYSDLVKYQLQ